MTESLTYAEAGVDIDKSNRFVDRIKEIAGRTPRSGVMAEIGGFGGLFSLNVANIDNPVLVSSTDGVGTKVMIAIMAGKHDTLGVDLVAMCVNDIAVQGAKPLFFLDYLAFGKLDEVVATELVQGIAEGCNRAHCALIGGETAEMPGVYLDNHYDLAGFAVGIVDNAKIIDGTEIGVGHKLIGIPSSGVHSNGFSLVRKICFDKLKLGIDSYVPELKQTLGEELLTPTRIYSETILRLLKDFPVHGFAHITGGGIPENIVRVIPKSCMAVVERDSWEIPPVFRFLRESGNVEEKEMLRVFNNGIGLIAVVPADCVDEVLDRLGGMYDKAYVIGKVVERKDADSQFKMV